MADAELDVLTKAFFDWYCEWNPAFATYAGVHAYDALLPRGDRAAVAEQIRHLEGTLRRLEEIDRASLSPGKRVDWGVMRNSLRLYGFQDRELAIWQARPQAAEDLAQALFYLFMRDFAPLPQRLESVASRLEKAPAFLAASRERVTSPTRIWSEIGLESTEQVPAFLEVIRAAGRESLPGADRARLEEAIETSKAAIAEYGSWIKADVLPKAQDRVGVGAAKFRKLVRLRELGLTVEEIYAIGKRYLRESKRELARLAGEIRPGATVPETLDAVKSDHPATYADAIAYTAKVMAESRRYIMEHDIATVPAKEALRVIETPSYLRHVMPFAAYTSPGRFDARQEGFYLVTTYEDKPEMLRELSYAGIRNTAVHEGYPGHHLQLSCANLNPSYARLMADAVESVEGWAHYCEDMMKVKGFSADPATKVVQMTDQIWRACRILIDVDLHCGRMTFDEAVDFLVRETGMERAGAVGEVKRYTYTPAYPLSYLVGKHLIVQLKKDVRKGLGTQYTDKFFHDTYLYAGSIPMKYMRDLFAYKIRELQKLKKKGL